MIKKITTLSLIISLLFCIPVYASDDTHTPQSDIASEGVKDLGGLDVSIAENGSYTITQNGEPLQPSTSSAAPILFDVPEKILQRPTKELLEYLLASPIMSLSTLTMISSTEGCEASYDLSQNDAFNELLGRSDLQDVLAEYSSANINDSTTVRKIDMIKEKVAAHIG